VDVVMTIGRRMGGAPWWLWIYAVACAATLLLTLGVFYLTTVHVRTAVAQFARDAAVPRPVNRVPYADLINRTAQAQHLNPALLAAVAVAESGFDARARSPRGAYGLMQVMPATWRDLHARPACAPEIARLTSPPCMNDPAANLAVGAAYLRRLADRFDGNLVLAVAAYNAGAGPVRQHRGVPPFPETTRYVRQVALAWFHLQRDGTLTPFWLRVIRSFDVWQHARPALIALLAMLAAPWVLPVLRLRPRHTPATGPSG